MGYNQSKLQDKIYGELWWNDWEDEPEDYWNAQINNESGSFFEVMICCRSQTDLMAVRGTHAIYHKILSNISILKDQMIAHILDKAREHFINNRQKKSFGTVVKRKLAIYNIKFDTDLTSVVAFIDSTGDRENPKEIFYAYLDRDGDFIKATLRDV